jgi:hypothetical protein
VKAMSSISTLKQLLLQATELEEPLNYFFDMMDKKALFSIKGHRAVNQVDQHDELVAVIAAADNIVSKLLNRPAHIVNQAFFEIPDQHFFHGICFSQDIPLPLALLYFSDIQMGMVALMNGEEKNMFRFALAKDSDLKTIH